VKTIALCAGVLFALAGHAGAAERAVLVGERVIASYPGSPILICQYAGPEARYEIVSPKNARCARYLPLS